MKIIEITRGEKPEGHCFKFGVTTDRGVVNGLDNLKT
jgi:hypothetical protein